MINQKTITFFLNVLTRELYFSKILPETLQ